MALPVWAAQWRFGDDASDDDRSSRVQTPLRCVPEPAASVAETDRALVAWLRTGDEQALAEVFRKYYDRLCVYAMRILGSRDLAESAVLDVMTSLWDRRDRLEVRGTIQAYLVGAVRMRAANLARSTRTETAWEVRAAREETVPGMAALSPAPDVALRVHEIERALEVAVNALPPRCREVFELSWHAGLTYAEIAKQLGISIKGVEGQMTRAYRNLRIALASIR